MTKQEWENTKARLTRKINHLRKILCATQNLAEKIKVKAEIKVTEDQLHEHKLNYYQLVSVLDGLPAKLTPEFFMAKRMGGHFHE